MSLAKERRPVRARALLLGALLIPPLLYWQLQLEMKRYSFPTWAVPFYHTIFVLFWLAAANLLLRRWRPRAALTSGEMTVIYLMLSIAAALFSVDMMCILVATMAYPGHVTTAAGDLLPRWLIVSNEAALKGYYTGHSSFYHPEHLKAWLVPIAAWSLFILVLVGVMFCLNLLLRRQWIERERLSYPIVQLPLGLVSDEGDLLRRRMLWAGFAVAAVITLVNGLQFWIPTLPTIPVKRHDLRDLFASPPWSAVRIGSAFWSMYPFAIGLSFLAPLDLSFSIWVFFLLNKLQLVVAHAAGYAGTQVPYSNQQSIGAYLAILCGALWMGRGHFREVFRGAFSRNAGPEARSERWAILGLGAGLLLLYAFLVGAGLSPAIAAAFLGLYLAIVIMITRIRAELGFPVHDLAGVGPHHTLVAVLGTPTIGASSLAGFGLLYAFVRRFTSHPMPHHLEALKMADLTGTSPRVMSAAGLLAAALGIGVGFWIFLDRYYAIGAESAYWNGWTWWLGREAMNTASGWVSNPANPDPGAIVAAGGGFGFALLLTALRLRLGRFPFHPLAYAVAPSWGIANLWSCVLIAWLAKAVILRWAGLKGYRRAVPFFLGLVLGEFVCGAGWTLAGILLDQPSYDFWP